MLLANKYSPGALDQNTCKQRGKLCKTEKFRKVTYMHPKLYCAKFLKIPKEQIFLFNIASRMLVNFYVEN